jgi:hypothetical protein
MERNGHDGRRRSHQFRDLPILQILQISEREHLSRARRQLSDCLAQMLT